MKRKRWLARLDKPNKRGKYNPADLDARAKWSAYQRAYADAIEHCGTDAAPWFVIPSDRKWYRNWAVSALLLETLQELAPQFPAPSYDVATERRRVQASVIR